ncbi:MAG: hypothetical protein KTR31_31915 [Myxococcales bacterium]|nr:hypothetical protein [Myxococcales bacterium]
MSVLIALSLSPALAFAPQEGTEDINLEPQRIQVSHPEVQAKYLRSERWQRFVESDGRGWHAKFDEHTGTPRVMWGRGIPMPTHSEQALAAGLQSWLDRNADVVGHEQGSLRVKSVNYSDFTRMWYVDFDEVRGGLPTYRGGVSARVKQGRLILLHVATAPRAPVTGALTLNSSDAIAAAIAGGPAPSAEHTEVSAEPILLSHKSLQGLQLRHTWMVRSRTAEPVGIWVTFVDGATGELLNIHNEVRFINGTVEAEHHARTPDGSALVTSGVPSAVVTGNGDTDVTDAFGDYDVTKNNLYTTDFDGDYLQVFNSAGGEGALSSSNPNMTWTTADATQSEIDTYIFTHQVRDWGLEVEPNVGIVVNDLTAYVNINSNCNAYYDGNINFFTAGGGCNNTGEIADVVYHEWGHGFHATSLEAGFFDSSLSEGASDTVSAFITGDNVIAPYFGTGGGAIRDIGPDRIYPDDYVASQNNVHSNGLIFGGTMWDLWDILVDLEGESLGTDNTEAIFAGTLKGGTDIPGTFFEALAADDNDGDLNNGTPHICEIYEAFGAHGLGPAAGTDSLVLASHEPLTLEPAELDHELAVELIDVAAGCEAGDAESATVHYRVNGGAWENTALTALGDSVEGAIPGQAADSIVEYYIEGASSDGNDFTVPAGGVIRPYTFYVGETLELHCRDFEANDGGYTHSLIAGEPGDGADDWQWGTPNGRADDPAAAYSGDNVWGNDLGYDNFNGEYQPNKVNALESREVETDHYTGVFLQYRRWLNVEDNEYDRAVIFANDNEVWTNWDGVEDDEHHRDGEWVHHVVDLQGHADQGTITLKWQIESDPGLEFGGWNIDDVCLLAPATPDNRLGITDFVAEAAEDTLMSLSWTNPIHEPLAAIKIVRRFNDFPAGHDDGDVVYEVDEPIAGGSATATDRNYRAGTSYYAVYGFDGTDWLSWTVEGWNAASADLVGGIAPEGWPTDTDGDGLVDDPNGDDPGGDIGEGSGLFSGCGCSGTPGGGTAAFGVVAALLLLRRRQDS